MKKRIRLRFTLAGAALLAGSLLVALLCGSFPPHEWVAACGLMALAGVILFAQGART